MATIKVRENGSYLVEGDDVVLIDWMGNQYEIPKRPFSLCRCGHSHRKPFCDGTHRAIGFQASESAAPTPPELPAEQANLAPAPGAPENADK